MNGFSPFCEDPAGFVTRGDRNRIINGYPNNGPMSLAVLADFDGTVTRKDASYEVLDHFSRGDWHIYEERALRGEISILEALREQAALVRGDPAEIRRHLVREILPREGFFDFVRFCHDNGIYLEICSDGFGFTIEILLSEWDLDIFWTSNYGYPTVEGLPIEFRHAREGCPVNANCKCSHLERLEERFDRVLFVGDGGTDLCVSRKARTVFARGDLASRLADEGISFIQWSNWEDVMRYIEATFPGY